jgi:hypothetical protein
MDALSGPVFRNSGTCDRKERKRNMTHEIDALEGEALAAAVAEWVMGWAKDCYDPPDSHRPRWGWWDEEGRSPHTVGGWRPDRDIAQAFEAVDRIAALHPGWWFSLEEYDNMRDKPKHRAWRAMWQALRGMSVWSDHADRCVAICRACLKAVGEVQE